MGDPDYIDIVTSNGTLRVVYEVTIGDLLISSLIIVAIVLFILRAVIRSIWR